MADMSSPAEITDAAGRRAAIVDQIRADTGIDEAMIARLVDGFYDRVRTDPLIGPVSARIWSTIAARRPAASVISAGELMSAI